MTIQGIFVMLIILYSIYKTKQNVSGLIQILDDWDPLFYFSFTSIEQALRQAFFSSSDIKMKIVLNLINQENVQNNICIANDREQHMVKTAV